MPRRQTIQAASQATFIAVICGEVPDNVEGTIEGSTKLGRMNLMSGKVLTFVKKNRVPILIRNPHPYPISIYKGTAVGNFNTHEVGVEYSNLDVPHSTAINAITFV